MFPRQYLGGLVMCIFICTIICTLGILVLLKINASMVGQVIEKSDQELIGS